MPNSLATTSKILKALAEPTRLRIVTRLRREGPVTVLKLSQELDMHIATVSHHLSLLRQAGLIASAQRGRFVTYSLHPAAMNDGKLRCGACQLEFA